LQKVLLRVGKHTLILPLQHFGQRVGIEQRFIHVLGEVTGQVGASRYDPVDGFDLLLVQTVVDVGPGFERLRRPVCRRYVRRRKLKIDDADDGPGSSQGNKLTAGVSLD
jgi:hypothetical protein